MIGGYDTPYCLYTVSNAGDLPLDWTVSADQPWVSFMDTNSTPISGGTLQPQASQDMYAYVDWLTTDEMTVGTYTATITFDASASGGNILTRDVSVRLTWLGDFNYDGAVDVTDLMTMIASFGTSYMDMTYNWICDLNMDGYVDVIDLLLMIDNWGKGTS